MRGLFFKVFIIFWIAQSLIFVISTALILNRRVPKPDFFLYPVFESLRADSAAAVSVYEKNGCPGLHEFAQKRRSTVILENESGEPLCGLQALPPGQPAAADQNDIAGRQVGDQYLWAIQAVSAKGNKYRYLIAFPRVRRPHTWYEDLLHFSFPQLPVAIAVGGLTTFVLVLIFTRPVVRLRKAARELAHGNLKARVKEAAPGAESVDGDEIKGLVRDFNHMAERLESLVDAQKLLLRDVSHELRSPLARLSVALELSREDADQTMATHLARIEREAERLNQLIGQLLTLSSWEAVENGSRWERVSLKQLLDQMIPDAEYEARQRSTSIVLQAQQDCVVNGNRGLLYRAIENVVRNSIRYTGPGSEVEITLRSSQENSGRQAVLEISDRGPGIPESELQSVFRPFYRVDPARSASTGGFGVGLAIAERAVKLHKGEIRAFNRDGGGLTIRIYLPMD